MRPTLPSVMRFARLLCAALACLAIWPSAALAQQAPPQPALNNPTPAWIGYLVMFVLLLMILGVSLMPSKRSHQE